MTARKAKMLDGTAGKKKNVQEPCQDEWEWRWEEEEPQLIASLCFNQQRLWLLIPSWSQYEKAQIEKTVNSKDYTHDSFGWIMCLYLSIHRHSDTREFFFFEKFICNS